MNSSLCGKTGGAILLIVGLCALLTGCSSSPSSGDGERAIQNRINEQSQGRVKLTKFEKSNGTQGELMGFKIYGLEFDAEIEFTEDCKWITGMFGQQLSFQTSKPVAKPGSGFSWNSFLDDTTNPGTLVKKGQRVKLSGVVRFVKKEKGWAVDGVELTKADVRSTPQSVQPQAGRAQEQPESPAQVSAPVAPKVEEKVVEIQPITENTEAWEFEITSREELPQQCSLPAFSKDFSKIAYVASRQLVVRPVASSKPIKTLRLAADVSALAFSPDEKKVACKISSGGDLNAHLLFVDLETEKVTPIRLDSAFGDNLVDSGLLFWPNQTNLYIRQRTTWEILDLDTLKTTEMRGEQLDEELEINSHKKAALRRGDYIRGSQWSLVLDSPQTSYARVMVLDSQRYGCRYGWSPDLRFFFEWRSTDNGGVCTIYKFGVRPKPRFEDDFELKGLQSALSENQRKAVTEALANKKQVWFTIFHALKNPLNDKIIGPDRSASVALGRGLVTSLGDTAHVTYGVEHLPISEGDVAADFWIREGDSFGDVWATITRIGK